MIKPYRVGEVKGKRSKYGNKKIKIDDITFDSTLEAKRYTQLKMLVRAKKIGYLKMQPKFLLQAGFIHNEVKYQAINYVADFSYVTLDGMVVEDVKGAITDVYAMKKKMFLLRYGKEIIFKELFKEDI